MEQKIQIPNLDERLEYLTKQKVEIQKSNFKAKLAKELQELRKAKAEATKDYNTISKIETELKSLRETVEGNNEYLEVIDKYINEVTLELDEDVLILPETEWDSIVYEED